MLQEQHNGLNATKTIPSSWFRGLDIETQVISLHMTKILTNIKSNVAPLEETGNQWMDYKQDPYGWFQWYCCFYRGRRTDYDRRQIDRWLKLAGPVDDSGNVSLI